MYCTLKPKLKIDLEIFNVVFKGCVAMTNGSISTKCLTECQWDQKWNQEPWYPINPIDDTGGIVLKATNC